MTVKDLSGQAIKGYELHEMIGAAGLGRCTARTSR